MLRAEVQLREPFDQLSRVAWALRQDGSVKLATRPGAGLKRRGAAGVIKRNGVRRTPGCVRRASGLLVTRISYIEALPGGSDLRSGSAVLASQMLIVECKTLSLSIRRRCIQR